jgi:hypothetical protein
MLSNAVTKVVNLEAQSRIKILDLKISSSWFRVTDLENEIQVGLVQLFTEIGQNATRF